jgi:hypothetical protein
MLHGCLHLIIAAELFCAGNVTCGESSVFSNILIHLVKEIGSD